MKLGPWPELQPDALHVPAAGVVRVLAHPTKPRDDCRGLNPVCCVVLVGLEMMRLPRAAPDVSRASLRRLLQPLCG